MYSLGELFWEKIICTEIKKQNNIVFIFIMFALNNIVEHTFAKNAIF